LKFDIRSTADALTELNAINVFYRRSIVEAIETQLPYTADVPTRNRKVLEGFKPTFEHVPPVWELRVGEFRVFDGIGTDDQRATVFVRAVRRKPPHVQTEKVP
jgi:hypothetical protein